MRNLKPEASKITLGGVEYGMRFNLNVIDDIQDKFDIAIEELPTLLNDPKARFKNLKALIAIMVNENAEIEAEETGVPAKKITERYVGGKLNIANAEQAAEAILSAVNASLPEPDEEAPNA